MTTNFTRTNPALTSILVSCLMMVSVAARAQFVWTGAGGDDNWSTTANWLTLVAPANDGTANVIFSGMTRLTPNSDMIWDINAIIFDSGAGAFISSGMQLTLRAGGVTHTSPFTEIVNNDLILGAAQTWTTAVGDLVVNGRIAGTSPLTKTGPGTAIFAGPNANTYSGLTTVNQGTLRLAKGSGPAIPGDLVIGNDNDPPGSAIVWMESGALFSGHLANNAVVNIRGSGRLDLNGAFEHVNALSASSPAAELALGSGQLDLFDTVDDAFVGLISGPGDFYKFGPATLTLPRANTFSRRLAVFAGTVAFGNDAAAGTATIKLLNGSTVRSDGAGRVMNNTVILSGDTVIGGAWPMTFVSGVNYLENSLTLTVNNSVTTFAGGLGESGPGKGLTKTGPGTLVLAGNNTYTGTTVINQGTLQAVVLPRDVVNNGILILTGDGDNSGTISGPGPLIKNGPGTATLSGTSGNTYSGLTMVNQGTLRLAKSSGPAIPGDLVIGNDNDPPGTAVVQLDSGALFSGHLANNAAVNILGSGRLDLNGAFERVNVLGASSPAAELALGAGQLDLFDNVDSTFVGLISGPGNFYKFGPGTLTLPRANTFSRRLAVFGGTVAFGNDAAAGTAVIILLNGSTVRSEGAARGMNNTVILSGDTVIAGAAPITFVGGGNTLENSIVLAVNNSVTTFANGLGESGAGRGLTKIGPGMLVLEGNNPFTGELNIGAGLVSLGGAGVLSGATRVTLSSGAVLDLGSGADLNRVNDAAPVVMNGGTLIASDKNEALGMLMLNADSTIELQLGGVAGTVTFSGATRNGGTLRVNNWFATPDGHGLDDRLFLAVDPGAGVLAAIQFTGFPPGAARLNTGELVPSSLAAPRLSSMTRLPNGHFRLQSTANPGQTYHVEASTTLTNWTLVFTVTVDGSGMFEFTDTNAPAFPFRFYRSLTP